MITRFNLTDFHEKMMDPSLGQLRFLITTIIIITFFIIIITITSIITMSMTTGRRLWQEKWCTSWTSGRKSWCWKSSGKHSPDHHGLDKEGPDHVHGYDDSDYYYDEKMKVSILCGVISAILVVILVIAITMKIRFGLFSFCNQTFIPVIIIIEISIINILLDTSCHFYFYGDNAKTFYMTDQIIKIKIMIMMMMMMIGH